jgi:hypothetical protein
VQAILLLALAGALTAPPATQAPIDVYDLADYRLTAQVFEPFVLASDLIADVTRRDPAFAAAPLFTKEIALSDDAPAAASALAARLEKHPGLAAALETAKLTPREYAKFAIALVAAHLAHEFVNAGVLKRVPSGAPSENVKFVGEHRTEVVSVLDTLGIRY